jgi:hypothetical protein
MVKHTSESYAIESPRSENSWTESSSSCNSLSEFAFEMELPGMHGEGWGWLPSDLVTYDTGDAPFSQHHERDHDELPDLTWQRNSPKPVFDMKTGSASKHNPQTTHSSITGNTVNTVNTKNEQRHSSQAKEQSGQFTTKPICDELESWCAGCTPPPMMMKPMRSNTC